MVIQQVEEAGRSNYLPPAAMRKINQQLANVKRPMVEMTALGRIVP
jgi:hypothetical protein